MQFNAVQCNAIVVHWIQIDIFIVVNKYLIDSIKKYLMFPFNWMNSIFFLSAFDSFSMHQLQKNTGDQWK